MGTRRKWVLLVGLDQPLALLIISASVSGTMMCLYSVLLIVLNRQALPAPIKASSYRVAALVWSATFYGALGAITIWQQIQRLVG